MMRDFGSSPLTRGKLPSRRSIASQDGLIPAHAGKTFTIESAPEITPAHPRSRGENTSIASSVPMAEGSSPLTRGKLSRTSSTVRKPGLIPAHAGKTQSSSAWSRRAWAHPRSRGENTRPASIDGWSMGSSPLTRGKLINGISSMIGSGLIPAHAGKTSPCLRWRNRAWAHPRSRGENSPTRP